ncbi:MAG: DUF2062 domain-containing protein [Planctomycetota bacterium]|jgi:uncharacterized protein (TIGR03546 family)
MMLFRKLASLLRGKATPFQIFAACVLGTMIGFAPAFSKAPALAMALIMLLIVLNANLFLAFLFAAVMTLVGYLVLPVSFYLGRILLDGPTSGLFESLINMPVVAYAGLEYYAVTGGLALALIVGIISGFVVIRTLKSFRTQMAKLEANSELYQKMQTKKSVRLVTWVFLGKGHGKKKTYDDLLSKKIGNPIRVPGVILVVLVGALGYIGQMFLSEDLMTMWLQRGLQRANGATVDLAGASADLGAGNIELRGLAAADPNALETNILQSVDLQMDVDTSSLLAKKVAFDSVVVREAEHGTQRAIPGVLIGKAPKPSEEPPAESDASGKTIDDYMKQAQIWQERLAQVRRVLEKMGSSEAQTDAPENETLSERLARQAAALGYANVKASHLISGAPSVLVRELTIDGMASTSIAGEVFDIRGTNLSTNPSLLDAPTTLTIQSRSGAISASLSIDPATGTSVRYTHTGISADAIAAQMSQPLFAGGTIDISIDAVLQGVTVDAPLSVTLHNTTLTLPGGNQQHVDNFTLPIALRGPIDAPRITVSSEALNNALQQAGLQRLQEELGDEINDALGDELGEEAGNLLKGVLGGDKNK